MSEQSYILKSRGRCPAILALLCAVLLSGCGAGGGSGDIQVPLNDIGNTGVEPELSPTLPVDQNLQSTSQPAVVIDTNGFDSPVVVLSTQNSAIVFEDQITQDGVHSITTFADTGLRLGFKGDIDADSVDTELVETSWTAMQTCLSVVAASPLVIVSSEAIEPLSSADDVLYYIDSSITATSTQFATGTTIQVTVSDLDGTFRQIGFNLRSIMGRYLWSSANLPERDYPHSCAIEG